MPDAQVGLIVWWYAGRGEDEQPSAAIVTAVGAEAIDVAVFVPGAVTNLPRGGVRHVKDPAWRFPEKVREGFWDYVNGRPPAILRQKVADRV
jgi:hypothetical protein